MSAGFFTSSSNLPGSASTPQIQHISGQGSSLGANRQFSSNFAASLIAGHRSKKVEETDPVYKEVVHDLEKAGQVLIQLERITNSVLEEKFQQEKEHLMRTKPAGYQLNMRSLYHGTSAPLEQICDEGLDQRLSRAGRFGQGIYFSDNPAKCCKYAKKSKAPSFLLRCNVIMGDIKEYTDGEHDKTLKREPSKGVVDGKRTYYDSVKGKPKDHTEYAIYETRRALIEYIVYYRSAKEPSLRREPSPVNFTIANGDDRRVASPGSQSDSGASSPTSTGSAYSSCDEDEGCHVAAKSTNQKQPATSNIPNSQLKTQRLANTGTASLNTTAFAPQSLQSSLVTQQKAALDRLESLKGTISVKDMKELITVFKSTYCPGPTIDPSILAVLERLTKNDDDDEAVSAVTDQLVSEFSQLTGLTDHSQCLQYISTYPNLSDAVNAYFDTTLFN